MCVIFQCFVYCRYTFSARWNEDAAREIRCERYALNLPWSFYFVNFWAVLAFNKKKISFTTVNNWFTLRIWLGCVLCLIDPLSATAVDKMSETSYKTLLCSSAFLYSATFMMLKVTAQKMKLSINDFLSKCDQICSCLRIWSHLLKKSLMENFILLCSGCYFFLPKRSTISGMCLGGPYMAGRNFFMWLLVELNHWIS